MAGHSHWAGIKHEKGEADKQRSKIFSKLSKEITVAAKLGDKDPVMNNLFQSGLLFSTAMRIAGGTDEVLRNIIAERVLGLPQDHRMDKKVAFKDLPTGRN